MIPRYTKGIALALGLPLLSLLTACGQDKPDCGTATQITDWAVTYAGTQEAVQLVRVVPSPGVTIANVTGVALQPTVSGSDSIGPEGKTLFVENGWYEMHGSTRDHLLCATVFTIGNR